MANENADENADEMHSNNDNESGRTYVVHIGGVKEKFDEAVVQARTIIELVEDDVDDFVLQSTKGKNGQSEAEFTPDEEVDLSEDHRTHFRIMSRGGGNA
jgi:hypothetical protein